MEAPEKKGLRAGQVRALKLTLDAIMLILLVLMYRKQVISLEFHEIGGLALIGLFIVHHLVNMRWIGAATKTLFAKGTSAMVRARYFVDVLLLLAFIAIGVTGILINKTLFQIHVAGNAKALHYFASALAIILMGVHLGLHADYIFGKLLKNGANKAVKLALAVVLAAMVGFGGYSLFSTQFVSFLSAPLMTQQFSGGDFQPSGEIALDGSQELPSDLSELPENAEDSAQPQQDDTATQPQQDDTATQPQQDDTATQPQQDDTATQPQQGEKGAQPPQGGGGGFSGGGQGAEQGGGQGRPEGAGQGQGGSSIATALLLIAQYVSIIVLFAAATVGVVNLTGKQKKRTDETAVIPAVIAEAEVDISEE